VRHALSPNIGREDEFGGKPAELYLPVAVRLKQREEATIPRRHIVTALLGQIVNPLPLPIDELFRLLASRSLIVQVVLLSLGKAKWQKHPKR
jgi:hypothetical protein